MVPKSKKRLVNVEIQICIVKKLRKAHDLPAIQVFLSCQLAPVGRILDLDLALNTGPAWQLRAMPHSAQI